LFVVVGGNQEEKGEKQKEERGTKRKRNIKQVRETRDRNRETEIKKLRTREFRTHLILPEPPMNEAIPMTEKVPGSGSLQSRMIQRYVIPQ